MHAVEGSVVEVGVTPAALRLDGTVTVVRPAARGAHLGRRGETNQVLTAAECVSATATVPTTLLTALLTTLLTSLLTTLLTTLLSTLLTTLLSTLLTILLT